MTPIYEPHNLSRGGYINLMQGCPTGPYREVQSLWLPNGTYVGGQLVGEKTHEFISDTWGRCTACSLLYRAGRHFPVDQVDSRVQDYLTGTRLVPLASLIRAYNVVAGLSGAECVAAVELRKFIGDLR